MELREFGKRSGLMVPPVNIGAMRLPQDVKDAVGLIRYAIDSGMRYIDTSRGYGESEWILGRALEDGYRDKVILSSKCSPWITKIRPDDAPTAEKVRHRLEETLLRLGVDYLDYYQVWNIDSREHYEQATAPGGMVDGILGAIRDGLVRRTGFTTHDSVENLLDYVKEADWCDIILFTYNLLNRQYAPAIAAAHENGIGTIIMNPVAGGALAEASPVLQNLADEVGAETVPELAIRFILSNPNVTTIISGISKKSDIDHTIAAAEKPAFSAEAMDRIASFLDERTPEKTGFCTACKYCLPCPQGIDIPAVMNCINDARYWGLVEQARRKYKGIQGAKADACTQCGACEKKCTQGLTIMAEMKYAAERL